MNTGDKWYATRKKINSISASFVLILMTSGNIEAYHEDMKTIVTPLQIASLGNIFPKPGNTALPDVTQFPEINVLSAKDYNNRGITYSQKGQYDLAISDFNKAMEMDPMLVEIYNNRGIAYSGKGQYDRAISDFNLALKMNSGLAKTYYNLGITYVMENEIELALPNFDKALEIDSSDVSAHLARSSVYMKLTCMDWKQACKYGSCDYIQKATKAGLCSE